MRLFCSCTIYFLVLCVQHVFSQQAIPIPPVLEGNRLDLTVQEGRSTFFSGVETPTIGFNGDYLGPTLVLQQGQQVSINVHNQLRDTTTVHWHGLNVSPANDGSPHVTILPGETWSPSFTVYDHASTYWYHPHMHGKTMQQVVLGAAGFIIVKSADEAALALPRSYGIDDVPLALQFKTFDAERRIVSADDLDNAVLVNGVIAGALGSPAQVVRYRLLNGSSHRYFNIGFEDSRHFFQIASDAGLLDVPVSLTRLILAPGERAEILVDLNGEEGNVVHLKSFGSDLPNGYPGGRSMMMGGSNGPLDGRDISLLKINVGARTADAITRVPEQLTRNTRWSSTNPATRSITFTAQPMMSSTNFFINSRKFDVHHIEFATQQDDIEVWSITNRTMVAHPFHVHGNPFFILDVNGVTPPPELAGRKDVVTVPPMNGSVRLVTKYERYGDPALPYMFHCHILSHEDGGMMGQFIVNPNTTHVGNQDQNENFEANPNPVSSTGAVNVTLRNHSPGRVEFGVYDLLGRQKGAREVSNSTSTTVSLDLGPMALSPGAYVVVARFAGGGTESRLISVR